MLQDKVAQLSREKHDESLSNWMASQELNIERGRDEQRAIGNNLNLIESSRESFIDCTFCYDD